jgi:hypothetical protein
MVGTLATGLLSITAHYRFFEDDDEYDDDPCHVSNHNVLNQNKQKTPNVEDNLLHSIPQDIWCNGILNNLDKKSIRTFLRGIGRNHVKSLKLNQMFCAQHGTKLEDSLHTNQKQFSCPDCYMDVNDLTRCRNCLVFYPLYSIASSIQQRHVWCQKCESMAFCNACLSHEVSCSSSSTKTITKHCQISKCNHCCPNVLTNTMCGEFVCTDCSNSLSHRSIESHDCDVCGKATCLDPHCLVCSHARLLYDMGGHDHDNRKYHIGQALVWISVWVMIVAIVGHDSCHCVAFFSHVLLD